PKFFHLVKAPPYAGSGSLPRPRCVALVVIDPVKIGFPYRTRPGTALNHWTQQAERNKQLGHPSGYCCPADPLAALDGCCMDYFSSTGITAGPPTVKFPLDIDNQQRQLIVQRGKLVFKINGQG